MNQRTTKILTKDMTSIGCVAALLCVLGPLSIQVPLTPIPITLTNLGIYLMVMVFGWKKGTAGTGIYILLGAAGLPVFSGFSGGLQKLTGPTGGYIFGYLLLAAVSGWFVERLHRQYVGSFLGMCFGTILLYALGTGWLCLQMHLSLGQGLAAGVLPYIPGDVIKMVLCIFVGGQVWKSVRTMIPPNDDGR